MKPRSAFRRLRVIALCAAAIAAPLFAQAKPNILIIYVDDLGYGDLRITGNERVNTPNIDALLRSGAFLREGYVSGAMCSPSRAGLISGRYQTRFGFEFNYENYDTNNNGMDKAQVTIAQRLKSAGYATGFIGKWHLGESDGFRPEQRGFDESMPNNIFTHVREREKAEKEGRPEPEDITLQTGRLAEEFFARHKNEPWFLYLAPHAVHHPFPVLNRYKERFDKLPPDQAAYYGMIECLDDAIGGVMQKLRELGMEENTLIFFASDNGAPSARPNQIGSNAPFRGYKYQLFDGGVHVPMAVVWKGKIPANTVTIPVIQIDFYPTALAAAEVEVKSEWKLEGVNLLPMLTGGGLSRADPLCWKIGPQRAIRSGNWKLIKPYVNAPAMLFDLDADAGEQRDLAKQNPEKRAELEAAWNRWNADNEKARWEDKRSDLRQGIMYAPKK